MSAPETQSPLKKITLRTADDQPFDVEENVAMEFTTLKYFLDENSDATDDIVFPLPNICADPLVKIIAYCRNHIELKARKRYDADFVKEQNDDDLKELILAANYLNIKHLLDVLNQEVANRIEKKSVEYVRRFFGIESDFTPEENPHRNFDCLAMLAPKIQPSLKKITLRTADDQPFDVEENVAMEFTTLKYFLDENSDATDDIVFPLPNVCADPLVKIIAYCRNHIELKARKRYAIDFVKEQKNDDLKELILAVDYLNIKHLLDVLNQEVANRIKNKSVEYVRRLFGIESDFTPEEEAKIRSENAWAFEGVDPDDDDEMQ